MAKIQEQSAYGMQVNLNDTSYEEAVEKATAALKDEGFGVLTEIDVKNTLKEKLDAEFRPYVILGACNPPLAKQALDAELEVGTLLPCNVIVYEDEGGEGSVVSAVEPMTMLGVVENPKLIPIADEVKERLRRVLESL
jgi:uncharacterized protein (DUF302 family)